ncbi:hypothetical protein JNW88_00130 [Micromonospora sp. ATA32]|nr:hypothetical protein [Micromonospora sp. ATA32]
MSVDVVAMPRPRPVDGKRCAGCEILKKPDEFYQGEKYDGGLSNRCKECSRADLRARRAANPDKARDQSRASYQRNKHRHTARVSEYGRRRREELKLTNPAGHRAKKFFDGHRREIGPDVTREYLEHLFRTVTHCQCCGKRLRLEYVERETRGHRADADAPSIDRVNNDKGYVRSNIAVICWECNFRKTDLTLADLQMFAKYIESFGDFDVV